MDVRVCQMMYEWMYVSGGLSESVSEVVYDGMSEDVYEVVSKDVSLPAASTIIFFISAYDDTG